jgi:hypothetical protein
MAHRGRGAAGGDDVTANQAASCGTLRAHQRHRRAGEEPCESCLEARRTYDRDRYVRRGEPSSPCGTNGAYQRHLRVGEDPCAACRDAHAEHAREYRERVAHGRFDRMLAEVWAEVSA